MSDLADRRFWDTEAAKFDEEPDHGLRDAGVRAAWRRLLAAWLPPAPADVLDVGCGTGTMALLALERGNRVLGVDASLGMLGVARAKLADAAGRAALVAGDAADPPLRRRTFDVVLCRHVVWALPDPYGALRRWAGFLRPGGRMVLVEGRWGVPAGTPWAEAGGGRPWTGGLPAEALAAAVRPLVSELRIQALPDPTLWGRPIEDERYAVLGWV